MEKIYKVKITTDSLEVPFDIIRNDRMYAQYNPKYKEWELCDDTSFSVVTIAEREEFEIIEECEFE